MPGRGRTTAPCLPGRDASARGRSHDGRAVSRRRGIPSAFNTRACVNGFRLLCSWGSGQDSQAPRHVLSCAVRDSERGWPTTASLNAEDMIHPRGFLAIPAQGERPKLPPIPPRTTRKGGGEAATRKLVVYRSCPINHDRGRDPGPRSSSPVPGFGIDSCCGRMPARALTRPGRFDWIG